jgi:sphingomyelin phosphodiesterase acid-like 3
MVNFMLAANKQFIRISLMTILLLVHSVFLSFSDIHFDPFTTCAKEAVTCPIITKLEAAPTSEWKNILAAMDTAPAKYKQDSNYPLLVSALQSFQNIVATRKPSFVLILGDYLAHHYKDKYLQYASDKSDAGYQAFVKKTMTFVTQEINAAFLATDVYMVAGNNDSDLGDNTFEPNGKFFQEMATLWSRAIKNPSAQKDMQDMFSHSGYYAVTLPDASHARLIVLNSNLFSPFAKGNQIEAAAYEQLDWLQQQLELSATEHQNVLIAMHIPAGIDIYASVMHNPFTIIEHWRPAFTQRFESLLQSYSANIVGVLASHEHTDWARVLANPLNHQKISMIGIPSISPFNKNNPAFKVFDYDLKTMALENYTKYFYLLDSTHAWQKEYEFNAIYQPECHDCRIADGISLLADSESLAMQYKKFYDSETQTDPIHTNYTPYYVCRLQAITATEYQSCLTIAK